ncbi:MAG: DUF2911 domain-containing protein [Rhodothermales bacterium]
MRTQLLHRRTPLLYCNPSLSISTITEFSSYVMKKNIFRFFVAAFALMLMVGTATAQERGDDSKQKSKNAEATGTIGNANIRVTYGAPHVNGRTVFGELEKWGKVWRAGANEATTVTFSEDVKVNGEALAAGTYSFFLIPQEKGAWTAIFNSVPNQWGAYDHDASKDVLRVDAKPSKADNQETLMYSVESKGDKGMLNLHWATTKVSVMIAAN